MSGNPGTIVTLTGFSTSPPPALSWDPSGSLVTCAFSATKQPHQPKPSTTIKVGPDGTFSATIKVKGTLDQGDNPITCTQTASNGTVLSASEDFTVS